MCVVFSGRGRGHLRIDECIICIYFLLRLEQTLKNQIAMQIEQNKHNLKCITLVLNMRRTKYLNTNKNKYTYNGIY